MRALWTTLPFENVLYLRTRNAIILVDLQGQNRTLSPRHGVVQVQLTDTPQYIIGEVKESFGYNHYTPIADNVYDYSSHGMGHNGWYYGRFVASNSSATYDPSAWQPLYINRNLWGTYWLQWASIAATTVQPAIDTSGATPIINWAVLRYKSNDTIANASLSGSVTTHRDAYVLEECMCSDLILFHTSGYVVLGNQKDGSDGVEARVYVDGRLAWHKKISPDNHHYFPTTFLVAPIDLVPGTLVDFVVTPGDGLNSDGDSLTSLITVNAPKNMSSVPSWVTEGDSSASTMLSPWLWTALTTCPSGTAGFDVSALINVTFLC